MTTEDAKITSEAIAALRTALSNNEVAPSSVAAAKALLKQFAPPKTDEEQKHEAEERDRAFTEAYGLLTELARYKYAFHRLQNALVTASKTRTTDPAGKMASLADSGWAWLGKDENRG
ncbi:MAG: hypothetical protein WC521_02875 [Bdellovibrionales bacterium]|jgi:hypothetical protein